jgi:DNA polymerase-1
MQKKLGVEEASDERLAVLLDVSGFIYRAFYAAPEMKSEDGRSVGAVSGFCSMLIAAINRHWSDLFFIALDSGRDTFRLKMFPEYKANRGATPDSLKEQIPLMHEACKAFGLPIIRKQGYEADDLIATYSSKLSRNGFKVKIIAIDKDLMQLVNDNVYIFDPVKSKIIDADGVVEKYGVLPSQMVFFQALVGDTSDNIPGVKGIGPVTASKLIKEYSTLDGIYENIDKITPQRIKEKLINYRNDAEISAKLATLDREVEVNDDFSAMKIDYNHDRIVEFLNSLGFAHLIKRVTQLSLKNMTDSRLIESHSTAKCCRYG